MAYNGWVNYESHNVYSWLSDEDGQNGKLSDLARSELRDTYLPGIDDEEDYSNILNDLVHSIALQIEIRVRKKHPLAAGPGSLYSDLLTRALSRVDWYAVARPFCEAAAEQIPFEKVEEKNVCT